MKSMSMNGRTAIILKDAEVMALAKEVQQIEGDQNKYPILIGLLLSILKAKVGEVSKLAEDLYNV